jgi:Tol biopolymer transport system component
LTVAELRGKIIFKSDRDGGPFNYYVMNADGSNIQRLEKAAAEAFANPLQAREGLSPDGSQIVLGERRCGYSIDIYTCALYILDTKLHADLIYSDREPSQGIWFVQNNVKAKAPVWSPRGDYIAFVSNHETPVGCRKTANLFKGTPTQKPVIRRLTEFCAGADTDHPSFSPDGSQIVFWSEFPTKNREIFVVDVGADDSFDHRNTTPRLLTPDEYNDWDPLWIK